MPSLSYEFLTSWSSYHLTIGEPRQKTPARSMTIEESARIYTSDTGTMGGLRRFKATAHLLLNHIKRMKVKSEKKDPQSGFSTDFDAGMVGTGWSFAPLIGTPVSQTFLDGLSGISAARSGDIARNCPVNWERIAFVSGGTRLREIVDWAERKGLSIKTSGTHLGPTIAGGFGTASHGSRLNFGGLQDIILGMHLITGENRHVWIERKTKPVLSPSAPQLLELPEGDLLVIQDDQKFEDALIHLGAMGFVNGVALALTPSRLFATYGVKKQLNNDLLQDAASGNFSDIAKKIGCNHEPQFYELTIDPFAPLQEAALHTMYFYSQSRGKGPATPRPTPADSIVEAASNLQSESLADDLKIAFEQSSKKNDESIKNNPDDDFFVKLALKQILNGKESVYQFYRDSVGFPDPLPNFDPNSANVPALTWGEMHNDVITGDIPGALYNASYAIPLDRLPAAIPLICDAVADLPRSFLFTVRFVSEPSGTLAFTRFEQNAVIEIDGLSPLICKIAKAHIPSRAPYGPQLIAALDKLATTLERGAMAVRAALDSGSIEYSMHWAKLGNLDKAKVLSDFDRSTPPDKSLIAKWRDTRQELLTPFGAKIFKNKAVKDYGLIP